MSLQSVAAEEVYIVARGMGSSRHLEEVDIATGDMV